MEKTLGEKRVRVDFNVTSDSKVDAVKRDIAHLIDLLERSKTPETKGEQLRLYSIAQTSLEEAAMWTVKALTSNEK